MLAANGSSSRAPAVIVEGSGTGAMLALVLGEILVLATPACCKIKPMEGCQAHRL